MTSRPRWPRQAFPTAAIVLAALALLAAAPLLGRSLKAEARRRAGEALEAVAALKVAQVVKWRSDQLRHARFAASYPSVLAAAAAAVHGAKDDHLSSHVSEILGHLATHQGHLRVALLAPDGAELGGWPRERGADPLPEGLVAAARAGADGAATDLSLDEQDRPYLDVAVTVGPPGARGCALFLRADAGELFRDVVERWPVPSAGAASALARREADGVRLMLGSRDVSRGGGPSVVVFPLAEIHRPVVRAFLGGGSGVSNGRDHRGERVLVASHPIPGTAWRVQAKIPLDEVEAPILASTRIIFGLLAALVLGGAVTLTVWWHHESARAALDARLRDAQDRLALAVSATHAVWDWDLASGELHVEPEGATAARGGSHVLRGSIDEILPHIVHADDAPGFRTRFEAHLRGETPLCECEIRAPGGGHGPRWIQVRGRVSRRDPAGRPLRFTAVVSDVTERRAMQAQLELSQRMASLGTLAAGVAHEINNPLTSVSASLDLLARELGDTRRLADALADARDGAERVRDVVRGLRAFSTRGAAAQAPADVRVELEAAIRLARNEIRHRARLEVRIDELPLVEAGAHELGQVFLNLLLNAAQAIPEGRAEENLITVEAGRAEDGSARVAIHDTGAGIPPQVLERVFEPFFTTKPLGVGTGLGLAIAHRIVTAARGRIDVETQVGRGTTFRVTLPAARAASVPVPVAAPAPAAPASPPPIAAPAGSGPRRVLVVDDDALVVRSVVRTLGKRFAIETAGSAVDAFARIERGDRFDAVLCDLMMPQMTGMELHARVSARDPGLAARIVFITGGAFTDAATSFLARVPNVCLEKPFDPARLREAVEAAAGG